MSKVSYLGNRKVRKQKARLLAPYLGYKVSARAECLEVAYTRALQKDRY